MALPDQSLFEGGNCPELCPGQLFLEYTPIYVQKSAFKYDVQPDLDASTTFQNSPSDLRLT